MSYPHKKKPKIQENEPTALTSLKQRENEKK